LPYTTTEEFVEEMLNHLLEKGPIPTRREFLGSSMEVLFEQIWARVKSRNFDFDARVFLSLIMNLSANASILDLGAGNNNFLPAMADRAARRDISYYATDYFTSTQESLDKGHVRFVCQPSPDKLPDVGPFALILLRRVAHHLPDFTAIAEEIKRSLKHDGLLVLIEDTYDDSSSSILSEMFPLVDRELTEQFYASLNDQQKIRFLQFNDFYSNYVYHNWTTMPLPMAHKTMSQWEEELSYLGLTLHLRYNMGFPKNVYNIHQAATGILCFRKDT
jgi:SAM-dependent methyltransferase